MQYQFLDTFGIQPWRQIAGLALMSEFERGLADALGEEKLAGFREGAEAARHWLEVCLQAERSSRE